MVNHNCELEVNSSTELNSQQIAFNSSDKDTWLKQSLTKLDYINTNEWIIFILLNSISVFFIAFAYSCSCY